MATALFLAPWAGNEGISQSTQLWIQLRSVLFTAAYAGGLTLVILIVMKAIMGDLRVSEEDEHEGLDLSQHSETAYGAPN